MARFAALLAMVAFCAQAQTPPDVPVLHATTSLVNVDVIVTDGSNHPIHNLPASAFSVIEDGHPQRVTHFEEHKWTYAPAPAQPLPAGVFTNQRPPHDDTLNIVVLDALNTPVQAQMYAAGEIRRWVQRAPDGPQIAIVKLTTGLEIVQGFTTDKRMLLDAVSHTKAVQQSILGPGGDGRFGYVRAAFRADYTNAAYKSLAHFAAMYPGKKNILWFTGGGYPAPRSGMLIDDTDPGIFFEQAIEAGQRYLVNMSDVSVYVIGSRGLETNAAFDASHGRTSLGSIDRWQENEMYRDLNMMEMGDQFGGKSFINTNDLAGAMQDAIELGSNYYTLSYRPEGHDLDGQEHRVHVRVAGGAYQLGYRRTYTAVVRNAAAADNKLASKSESAPFKPQTATDLALGAGSPQLDGIVYQVRFVPIGKPDAVTNTLVPDSTKDPKLKAAFHNFNLSFVADTRNMTAGPADGGMLHMSIEFIVTTYDSHGFPQTSIAKTMVGNFKPEKVAELKRTGHLDITIPVSVPAHGDTYVRTAVHDNVSGKMGTLEVPSDMLKNLPPA
jgi:VWFA-related protein